MKKNIILIFLFIICPILLFAGGQSEAGPSALVTGVVEYYDGEVTVNDQPVEFGMKVPFGAVVTTGPESYCEIVFDRKNVFRIQESTIAEIKLAPVNPEITIKKGAFAALFNKLEALTSDEPFKVRTQTATAGVRGTAFYVKVLDDNNTYICICNGELDVEVPGAKDSELIAAGHHNSYYYRNIDGVIKTEPAPMLYHDDDDMEALGDSIDENIKWYY